MQLRCAGETGRCGPACATDNLSLYAFAMEQAGDSIVITEPNGRVIYVNHAFEKLTGYSRAEAVGRSLAILKSGEMGDDFYRELWSVIASGKSFEAIFLNRKKNGSLFSEEKVITPLRDAAGRITHYVSAGRDVTFRLEAERRLRELACYDDLTKLHNRASFFDSLDALLSASSERCQGVTLVLIDLDRFKGINDALGHDIGDQVLVKVAARLAGAVRGSDIVARLGGDEFTIALAGPLTEGDREALLQRISDQVEAPIVLPGMTLYVGASMGVSRFPDDGGDSKALFKQADISLYEAKREGRGRTKHYSPTLKRNAERYHQIYQAIRRAFSAGELWVAYQPMFDLRNGQAVGAEALVRWNSRTLGPVPPTEFLPVVHDLGLGGKLTDFVLERACQDLARTRAELARPFSVSVNMPADELHAHGLSGKLEALLARAGLPAGALKIEITEGALVAQDDGSTAALESLTRAGVDIYIDDFGTGYSNLGYLGHIPLASLKIARQLIAGIRQGASAGKIVRAILHLASALGVGVIAEGVETREELRFLEAEGCQYAQGFALARPMPIGELLHFLKTSGAGEGGAG
ncbi:putative bifunctional diguanylate cyclase/phosphodiesterase [Cupriavidus malaysiensis]|nr:EAL domain-containing protein [Cupriavidus malaysiensis]